MPEAYRSKVTVARKPLRLNRQKALISRGLWQQSGACPRGIGAHRYLADTRSLRARHLRLSQGPVIAGQRAERRCSLGHEKMAGVTGVADRNDANGLDTQTKKCY